MTNPTIHSPRPGFLNTLLWGNTVALSWVWGLGLFFSVQFTVEFGLTGLLTFLIPNCLGLFLFGAVADHIARRNDGSGVSPYSSVIWSRPFRLVFFLYQLLAITLTIFALIRYGWHPLGLRPDTLYLPLTALIILAGRNSLRRGVFHPQDQIQPRGLSCTHCLLCRRHHLRTRFALFPRHSPSKPASDRRSELLGLFCSHLHRLPCGTMARSSTVAASHPDA